MGNLFIITGASGSGKTTLLNEIIKAYPNDYVKAAKYSTRDERLDSPDDIISVGDISEVDQDITYIINDVLYAINTKLILDQLNSGKNALIIISDFRVLRILQSTFKERCVSIYLSSFIDESSLSEVNSNRHGFDVDENKITRITYKLNQLRSAKRLGDWALTASILEELNDTWASTIPKLTSLKARIAKIRTLHTRYIDNIELFDAAILNFRPGKPNDMVRQFVKLHENFDDWNERRLKSSNVPRVYIVCASSGAGKGELLEATQILSNRAISLVDKYATREAREGDKQDGMITLGVGAKIPSHCDMRWRFHQSEEFEGVEYGISTSKMITKLKNGQSQILVSNFSQLPKFREMFGSNLTVLYLHRAVSQEAMIELQKAKCSTEKEAEARVGELDKVYEDFIENFHLVDHLLLNTSEKEDLFDQIMSLLQFISQD